MGLYTELFYAIIPTLFSMLFADLLSLHLDIFNVSYQPAAREMQAGWS